ncbi:MAG TPA: alpha-amylase family glycosyl hydrolase, partial [Ignavibacteriaceae bacterium]
MISGSAQENFPEWAKGIVWYQIFPERFANGDTSNDPEADKVFINSKSRPADWKITKWTADWFAQSSWEKQEGGSLSRHLTERRYGGDIEGIIEHLDYLKNLGIGAIYLNPMFEAVSMHKYDGSTYHHIDVNFGPDPSGDRRIMESEVPDDPRTWKWTEADKLFLQLISEVHQRGMKIIIDGVFNHTGVQFWAFQDIVKKGTNSKYKDWYEITSFDNPQTPSNEFTFHGWWNSRTLPQFNRTQNDLAPGPKQYILYATRRWMDPNNDGDPSDGIDGWRLDVAKDVPIGFWRDWRKLVKSINPSSIIIGELWDLSPDYISDNGVFDALMNYNFAFAVNNFFVAEKTKIRVTEFINRLKNIDVNYPERNLFLLQNLVDSHDTERISSMIANPDRDYDRDGNESNK